jgi:hypothetical protein
VSAQSDGVPADATRPKQRAPLLPLVDQVFLVANDRIYATSIAGCLPSCKNWPTILR